MELEEELKVVGNSLKSLEVSEEKVWFLSMNNKYYIYIINKNELFKIQFKCSFLFLG